MGPRPTRRNRCLATILFLRWRCSERPGEVDCGRLAVARRKFLRSDSADAAKSRLAECGLAALSRHFPGPSDAASDAQFRGARVRKERRRRNRDKRPYSNGEAVE